MAWRRRWRRRRAFRRRYYRRRYRRYKKRLLNASSRSRATVKFRSSFDISFTFSAGETWSSTKLVICPWLELFPSTAHPVPGALDTSELFHKGSAVFGYVDTAPVYEAYSNLYDEVKLDFMGLKFYTTTPVNGSGNNPNSLEFASCWDRKYTKLEWQDDDYVSLSQINSSPSSSKLYVLNNSVGRFSRWIKPSDLSEKIGWAPTALTDQTLVDMTGAQNVPMNFLKAWYNDACPDFFTPAFYMMCKRGNAISGSITSVSLHVDVVYILTFRSPRFGGLSAMGYSKGGDEASASSKPSSSSSAAADVVDFDEGGDVPPPTRRRVDDDGGAPPPDMGGGDDPDDDDDFGDGDDGGGAPAGPVKKLARIAGDIASESPNMVCTTAELVRAANAAGIHVQGAPLAEVAHQVCNFVNNHASTDTDVPSLSIQPEPGIIENITQAAAKAATKVNTAKTIWRYAPTVLKKFAHSNQELREQVELAKRQRRVKEQGDPEPMYTTQADLDNIRDDFDHAERRYQDGMPLLTGAMLDDGPDVRFVRQRSPDSGIWDRTYSYEYLRYLQEMIRARGPAWAREHLARSIAGYGTAYTGRMCYGQDYLNEAHDVISELMRNGLRYTFHRHYFNDRRHRTEPIRYTGYASMFPIVFPPPFKKTTRRYEYM